MTLVLKLTSQIGCQIIQVFYQLGSAFNYSAKHLFYFLGTLSSKRLLQGRSRPFNGSHEIKDKFSGVHRKEVKILPSFIYSRCLHQWLDRTHSGDRGRVDIVLFRLFDFLGAGMNRRRHQHNHFGFEPGAQKESNPLSSKIALGQKAIEANAGGCSEIGDSSCEQRDDRGEGGLKIFKCVVQIVRRGIGHSATMHVKAVQVEMHLWSATGQMNTSHRPEGEF